MSRTQTTVPLILPWDFKLTQTTSSLILTWGLKLSQMIIFLISLWISQYKPWQSLCSSLGISSYNTFELYGDLTDITISQHEFSQNFDPGSNNRNLIEILSCDQINITPIIGEHTQQKLPKNEDKNGCQKKFKNEGFFMNSNNMMNRNWWTIIGEL